MASSPTNFRQVINGDGDDFRVSSYSGFSYFFNTVSGGQNLIKTGAGILHGVNIGNATLTSAIVLYDNTISATANIIFKLATATSGQTYNIDSKFNTGLTLSAGSLLDNITVTYL